MIKWEQKFVNQKIVLEVKTVCSSPDGVTAANFATTKDVIVQSKNSRIG
jgi:hypothetical protein